MTILFPAHNWTSGSLVGTNIVVTEDGVTFQISVQDLNATVASTALEDFADDAQPLSCAVPLPVILTIDGEEVRAIMCLSTYNALVAAMTSPPKSAGQTIFREAKTAAKGFMTGLKKCCGG